MTDVKLYVLVLIL